MKVVTVIVAVSVCIRRDALLMQLGSTATLQPQKMTLSRVITAPLQGPYKEPRDKALGYGLCLGPARTGISMQEPPLVPPPSQRGRARTALSQPWVSLCSIYAHHCFTPGETHSPQLRGRLGLTNFINDCKALREAQRDGSHKVHSDICAEKMLFGPETLKGIKMPSRAKMQGEGTAMCCLAWHIAVGAFRGQTPSSWLCQPRWHRARKWSWTLMKPHLLWATWNGKGSTTCLSLGPYTCQFSTSSSSSSDHPLTKWPLQPQRCWEGRLAWALAAVLGLRHSCIYPLWDRCAFCLL